MRFWFYAPFGCLNAMLFNIPELYKLAVFFKNTTERSSQKSARCRSWMDSPTARPSRALILVHNKRLWSSQEASTSFPGLFPLKLGEAGKLNSMLQWFGYRLLGALGHKLLQVACLTLRPLRHCWAHGFLMVAFVSLDWVLSEHKLFCWGFSVDFGSRALWGLFTRCRQFRATLHWTLWFQFKFTLNISTLWFEVAYLEDKCFALPAD